jgi:hypothetical protein
MTTPFPQLTDVTGISAEAYVQAETYVMALLKESFPTRAFGYGTALYWHCVVPAAVAVATMQTNAELVGSSLSLKWIRDNPSLVNDELAAAILSNYYHAPYAGNKASGTVAIVVSEQAPYSVAVGTVFTYQGVNYAATQAVFAQVSEAEVIDTGDRLLTARNDGTWQFLVPVEAESVGASAFVASGVELTMPAPTTNFVKAVAISDISGGQDAASVKEAATEVPQTFAAQSFSGRLEVAALIAAEFPGTKTAVIGMGDPEQWRDTHNLLRVQTGGMVDLYEATQTSLGSETLEVVATLLSSTAKTWEFTLPREVCAGVYAVNSVVPLGDTRSSLVIASTQRSISIPATGYRPLIVDPAEAAFSAYQALTVRFTDTYSDHTGLVPGATRTYAVEVLNMPLIKEISDFLAAGRTTSADNVLVRAAVPCVTRIALAIRLLDSDSLTDAEIASMKQAIVAKVASRGFGYGVLSSSIIVDAVHDYISGRSDVGANTVTLRGDVYAPTGERMVLEGAEIRIPDEPSKMVTKNNTVFLTDVSRVDISFLPVEVS